MRHALVIALKDENADAGSSAENALFKIGAPVIPYVTAVLNYPNRELRYRAVSVLERLSRWAKVLMDKERRQPLACASAPIHNPANFLPTCLKDPSTVEALISVLEDEDEYIRKNAAEALERITGQQFGEDRAKWQDWWAKDKAK